MHRTLLIVALACPLAMLGPVPAAAAQGPYPHMAPIQKYLPASAAAEVAMARTAAPAAVSDKAEIMVFGARGYATAVHGSNGFVCFVERSWAQDFDDPQFWNPNIRTPQCWNAAAARSELPDYLERTRWVLAGVSQTEMLARTRAAWAAHEFGPPAPQSMAYMMSRDQYIKDPRQGAEARWYPHVMFFVPAAKDATWGANVHGGPIFSTTSDAEPVTTFFVLVPRWSDGSAGPAR